MLWFYGKAMLKIEKATPGIEIHENRHPQSCLALNSQIVT